MIATGTTDRVEHALGHLGHAERLLSAGVIRRPAGTGRSPVDPGRLLPAEARWVGVLVAAAAGLLGVVGFAVSFQRVSAAARPSFGGLAAVVPVGIDLGILVFCAAGLVLAWLDMPARWLRPVPWTLTAATVALNVAGQRDLFGVIAHAVLPGLWVLAVALGEHVVRHRLAIDSGRRMDSIRGSRWLLAPLATARLWRRMVLWEIRSYPAALARERDRLLALTELQDRYGRLVWRWHAPRRDRALYRLGELAPTTPAEMGTEGEAGVAAPGRPPAGQAGDGTRLYGDSSPAQGGAARAHARAVRRSPTRGRGRASRRRGGRGGTARRSIEDLRAELHAAVAMGRIAPRQTAEAIRKQLACAPKNARILRDELATNPLDEPAPAAPLDEPAAASPIDEPAGLVAPPTAGTPGPRPTTVPVPDPAGPAAGSDLEGAA